MNDPIEDIKDEISDTQDKIEDEIEDNKEDIENELEETTEDIEEKIEETKEELEQWQIAQQTALAMIAQQNQKIISELEAMKTSQSTSSSQTEMITLDLPEKEVDQEKPPTRKQKRKQRKSQRKQP